MAEEKRKISENSSSLFSMFSKRERRNALVPLPIITLGMAPTNKQEEQNQERCQCDDQVLVSKF